MRAPTWAALAAALPSAPTLDAAGLTLCREKNGWCIYSAQMWLALEIKGLQYDTRRVLASDAPVLHFPDGHGAVYDGTSALCELDGAYPDAPPLWPPQGIASADVSAMASAFAATVPSSAARESSRAAFLFRREEGFQYDPLPRETLVATLDATETLLEVHDNGPFFCGGALSAADVLWAPLLERYAAQLPCLYAGLTPRGGDWPRLTRWYDAMDSVPAYACRVKGDATSWRRVLSTSPWWPAGWPSRGDPDERGDPRGGQLVLSEGEAERAYASRPVSQQLWDEYAQGRPHVASTPAAEAAAALMRNAKAIVRDAEAHAALPPDASAEDYDLALRAIAGLLLTEPLSAATAASGRTAQGEEQSACREERLTLTGSAELSRVHGVAEVASYLVDRICVPRDVGAPVADAIRRLSLTLGRDAAVSPLAAPSATDDGSAVEQAGTRGAPRAFF